MSSNKDVRGNEGMPSYYPMRSLQQIWNSMYSADPSAYEQSISLYSLGDKYEKTNPVDLSYNLKTDKSVAMQLPKVREFVSRQMKPASEYLENTYCPAGNLLPDGVCLKSDGKSWSLSKDAGCWRMNPVLNRCGVRTPNELPYASDYDDSTLEMLKGANGGRGAIVVFNGKFYQFRPEPLLFGYKMQKANLGWQITDNIAWDWQQIPPVSPLSGLQVMPLAMAMPNKAQELDESSIHSVFPHLQHFEFSGHVSNNILQLLFSRDPSKLRKHFDNSGEISLDKAADYKFVAGLMYALFCRYGFGKDPSKSGKYGFEKFSRDQLDKASAKLAVLWEEANQIMISQLDRLERSTSLRPRAEQWRMRKYHKYITNPMFRSPRSPFTILSSKLVDDRVKHAAQFAACWEPASSSGGTYQKGRIMQPKDCEWVKFKTEIDKDCPPRGAGDEEEEEDKPFGDETPGKLSATNKQKILEAHDTYGPSTSLADEDNIKQGVDANEAMNDYKKSVLGNKQLKDLSDKELRESINKLRLWFTNTVDNEYAASLPFPASVL